ncbi:hypothetical protein Tco_0505643 [Tanacetum coccineum]
MLFQPLFDELLNPPPSVDHPAPEVVAPIDEVAAPVPAVSTGSPSSTTVDQAAPSPSNSQTTTDTQPPVIPNVVEEDNHDIEVAHMGNDPYFDAFRCTLVGAAGRVRMVSDLSGQALVCMLLCEANGGGAVDGCFCACGGFSFCGVALDNVVCWFLCSFANGWFVCHVELRRFWPGWGLRPGLGGGCWALSLNVLVLGCCGCMGGDGSGGGVVAFVDGVVSVASFFFCLLWFRDVTGWLFGGSGWGTGFVLLGVFLWVSLWRVMVRLSPGVVSWELSGWALGLFWWEGVLGVWVVGEAWLFGVVPVVRWVLASVFCCFGNGLVVEGLVFWACLDVSGGGFSFGGVDRCWAAVVLSVCSGSRCCVCAVVWFLGFGWGRGFLVLRCLCVVSSGAVLRFGGLLGLWWGGCFWGGFYGLCVWWMVGWCWPVVGARERVLLCWVWCAVVVCGGLLCSGCGGLADSVYWSFARCVFVGGIFAPIGCFSDMVGSGLYVFLGRGCVCSVVCEMRFVRIAVGFDGFVVFFCGESHWQLRSRFWARVAWGVASGAAGVAGGRGGWEGCWGGLSAGVWCSVGRCSVLESGGVWCGRGQSKETAPGCWGPGGGMDDVRRGCPARSWGTGMVGDDVGGQREPAIRRKCKKLTGGLGRKALDGVALMAPICDNVPSAFRVFFNGAVL